MGVKRETRVAEGVGPGAYEPELAERQTRTRTVAVNLSSSPERPQLFSSDPNAAAPGQYDSDVRFGQNTKSFTIGEKRETRVVETMGPGSYSPEVADRQTKNRTGAVDMRSSPERPNNFGGSPNDPGLGPG